MKKRQFFAVLISFLLIAGLFLTGCPDPNTSSVNVPGVPSSVTATTLSAISITVSWNAVSAATGYDVYYEAESSSTKFLAGSTSATSYIHTGLNPATTYKYYVKAKNSAGESGFSAPAASARTQDEAAIAAPRKTFWALNENDEDYQLQAELLAEGIRCNVWVGIGCGVTKAIAQSVAHQYDNVIYPRMLDAFGVPISHGNQIFTDPLAFADWMGDKDGKLTILILFIRNGADGYFYSTDLIPEPGWESNGCDMIYIDSGYVDFPTIAHEVQHIMNFATGYGLRGGLDGYMDLWIDEGLSSAAEWIFAGEHSRAKVDWFINNGDEFGFGLIDNGNNFFVWGNHEYNEDAIYDDYATVYLFFQWLRLQTGGSSAIYRDIASSNHIDHRAVTTAMNTAAPGQGYNSWQTLLKTWLIANALNAPTGPYGYANDPLLRTVHVYEIDANDGSRVRLYPGEGVYSNVGTVEISATNNGPNIRNTYFTSTGQPSETFGTSYRNWFLITYNINTDHYNGSSEYGRIGTTSSLKQPGMRNISEIRSVIAESSSVRPLGHPFGIDTTGLQRRIGRGNDRSSAETSND